MRGVLGEGKCVGCTGQLIPISRLRQTALVLLHRRQCLKLLAICYRTRKMFVEIMSRVSLAICSMSGSAYNLQLRTEDHDKCFFFFRGYKTD
jgi:hypothetical protein